MSKIKTTKLICACCGNEVYIDRLLSFSCNTIDLSGNKHTSMQYIVEECPKCHYISFDIADRSIHVTMEMLNAFRMNSGTDVIKDPTFHALLKAADIYEKNNDYKRYAQALRLAGFYAEELNEMRLYEELLRQSNEALRTYFESKDEFDAADLMLAIELIDGERRLGLFDAAGNMCEEILPLLEETSELRRLITFENTLLENCDRSEHFVSEVM